MVKFIFINILILTFSLSCINAQKINISDIDESEYPLIKVNIEISNKGDVFSDTIKITEKGKKVKIKVDSITTKNEGKTVLFLIDNSFYNLKNKELLLKISTLLSKSINEFEESDFVNVFLSSNINDCVFPLSYEFTDDFKGFSKKIFEYISQINNNRKKTNINCSIEKSLDILNSKTNLTNSKFLLVLLNKYEQNSINIDNLMKIALGYKIKLRFVICGKVDKGVSMKSFFILNSNYNYKKIQSVFENSINIKNKNYLYTSYYLLKFYTTQNNKINTFKIHYGSNIIEDKFAQPKYINYFKNNWLLTTLIILLLIIFTLVTTYLYFTKKIIFNNLTELQNSFKIKNIENSIDIISKKNGLFPEIKIKMKGIESTYEIKKLIVKIGRHEDNDIMIDDLTISNNHAIITNEGGEFFIQDIGSTNGIFVNDIKITKSIIKTTDRIRLGKASLQLIY